MKKCFLVIIAFFTMFAFSPGTVGTNVDDTTIDKIFIDDGPTIVSDLINVDFIKYETAEIGTANHIKIRPVESFIEVKNVSPASPIAQIDQEFRQKIEDVEIKYKAQHNSRLNPRLVLRL